MCPSGCCATASDAGPGFWPPPCPEPDFAFALHTLVGAVRPWQAGVCSRRSSYAASRKRCCRIRWQPASDTGDNWVRRWLEARDPRVWPEPARVCGFRALSLPLSWMEPTPMSCRSSFRTVTRWHGPPARASRYPCHQWAFFAQDAPNGLEVAAYHTPGRAAEQLP